MGTKGLSKYPWCPNMQDIDSRLRIYGHQGLAELGAKNSGHYSMTTIFI